MITSSYSSKGRNQTFTGYIQSIRGDRDVVAFITILMLRHLFVDLSLTHNKYAVKYHVLGDRCHTKISTNSYMSSIAMASTQEGTGTQN